MKQFITILALLILNVTFAQDKNARATIEVDGVCGMCKKRIETAAVNTEGVKSAVWSIQTHELALIYDESKTNLESISMINLLHDKADFFLVMIGTHYLKIH